MAAPKKSPVSADDRALFRNEAGPVRPLRHNQHEALPPRPAPIARQRELDEQLVLQELLEFSPSALDVDCGEELRYSVTGISSKQLNKLRRGRYAVEAELDLHGLSMDHAIRALREFFNHCQRSQYRCVRIIHGKGLGSRLGRPVIKPLVNQWLQRRADVLAFVSAPANVGGTGAVVVLRKIV